MTMTVYPHLLPPNSTALERALSGPTGRITALPVDISKVFSWDTCPAALLPWLAWELSVDVWDETWVEDKKRYVIREAVTLHRLKGTLEGIKRHVRLVGAEVIKAVVPPVRAFGGRSTTTAEHLAYLQRMPQVRIYQFRNRGATVIRGKYPRRKNFCGYHMPRLSDAYLRTGHQVFLWDKGTHPLATGEETQISYRDEVEKQMLELPGRKPARAAYPNAILHGLIPAKSTAKTRYYTLNWSRATDDATITRALKTATPGLFPIDLKAQSVAEQGTAYPGSKFAGRPLSNITLPKTTSGLRLYDVLYLFDKNRADRNRTARVFCGHQRLSIPDYTAELTIAIRNKKSTRVKFARGYVGQMPHTQDQRKLENVRRAVVSSKAFRDKILIDTQTIRHQRLSDGVPMDGSRTFGDRVAA